MRPAFDRMGDPDNHGERHTDCDSHDDQCGGVHHKHLKPHLEQLDDYLPALYQGTELHNGYCLAAILT